MEQFPDDKSGESAGAYVEGVLEGRPFDLVKAAESNYLKYVPFLEAVVIACFMRAKKLHENKTETKSINLHGDYHGVSKSQRASVGKCWDPMDVSLGYVGLTLF